MKPIIFVLGLSGAGKDFASKMLERRCLLLRKDMDRKGGRGFELAGFPAEWDKDIALIDFAHLAAGIREEVSDGYQGAVLSFPTTYRFSRRQLDVASIYGVAVVLVRGSLTLCMETRRKRQKQNKGSNLNSADYLRKNSPTFEMYEQAEYDKYKVEAFEQDGSRPSDETLLARILARLNDQGIRLNCQQVLRH